MNEIPLEALQQGSDAWKELRKKMIGASEIASILGVGFMTPLQIWEQKMGLSIQEENWAMSRGKELEPEARAAYETETGEIMFPSVEFNSDYPWAIASLDGINMEANRIVEIKCPGEKDHVIAVNKTIPEKYQLQMQYQMMVTGLQSADYWSYRDGKGVLLSLSKDEEKIKEIIAGAENFYFNHLVPGIPPPLSEKDILNREDEALWIVTAEELSQLNSYKKDLEVKIELKKEELISLSENKSSRANGFKFTKSYRKGSIDYSSIPDLVSIDLEKYRKTGVISWTFSTFKEK
jgi:putative phage-type endonuclease